MEKKTEVWISRADVCALLGAKRLYAGLPPGQDRLRAFFQTLSLQKFRDALRENCFQGGDAAEHVLVTVDPEVLLVLRAMGLCGASDAEGRLVCVLGEGSKKWYNPLSPTSRTANDLAQEQLGRIEPILLQAYQMLTGGSSPSSEERRTMEYIKVNIWHVIKFLQLETADKARHNVFGLGTISNSLKQLKDNVKSLATLITGGGDAFAVFLQRKAGCVSAVRKAWKGSCADEMTRFQTIIEDFFYRVVLASALYVFNDRDWPANWVGNSVGSSNYNEISSKKLLYSKTSDDVQALSAKESKARYDLGAPLDTVVRKTFLSTEGLQALKADFQSSRSSDKSPQRTVRPLASHESHESLHLPPEVLLLCQMLYLQFKVLFPETHLRDTKLYAPAALKDPQVQLTVQLTFQDLFPTAGTLLPHLRKATEQRYFDNQPSGSPTVSEDLENFYHDLHAALDRHPVVVAALKPHQTDAQKILTSFTQRLLEAVLMQRLSEENGLIVQKLQAIKSAQNLQFLNQLPVVWKKTEETLWLVLGETGDSTAIPPDQYSCGLPSGLDFSHQNGLQTKISTALRSHSALVTNHPHYDAEGCLEAFRPVDEASNKIRFHNFMGETDPSKVFSQEYLEHLKNELVEAGIRWNLDVQKNGHLEASVKKVVADLHTEVHEYARWHDVSQYGFDVWLEFSNGEGLLISPSLSEVPLLGPMVRWLLACNMVPIGAVSIMGEVTPENIAIKHVREKISAPGPNVGVPLPPPSSRQHHSVSPFPTPLFRPGSLSTGPTTSSGALRGSTSPRDLGDNQTWETIPERDQMDHISSQYFHSEGQVPSLWPAPENASAMHQQQAVANIFPPEHAGSTSPTSPPEGQPPTSDPLSSTTPSSSSPSHIPLWDIVIPGRGMPASSGQNPLQGVEDSKPFDLRLFRPESILSPAEIAGFRRMFQQDTQIKQANQNVASTPSASSHTQSDFDQLHSLKEAHRNQADRQLHNFSSSTTPSSSSQSHLQNDPGRGGGFLDPRILQQDQRVPFGALDDFIQGAGGGHLDQQAAMRAISQLGEEHPLQPEYTDK